MNKKKLTDIKIVRAKMKAKKALQQHQERWYGEEPEEAKEVSNAPIPTR